MTVRNLNYLMNPSSVALIGASERPSSVGEVITHNLLSAGYKGEIFLVNPHYEHLAHLQCYPDVAALPKAPDLAIIATPPETVPGLIEELAVLGSKAAVVITAGFGEGGDDEGKRLSSMMLQGAGPHLLRIVGPNCLGVMVPRIGLNAGMAHIIEPLTGKVAFVAQSGAVQTAVLDWAMSRGIGFSCLVSLGDMLDVDFGDMLDYLASDFRTRAILLYMETVTHVRKFMSAARAAARAKPVIVIKAGRYREGALAAARHTGAIAGDDAVCDAAFRRAGMLRVYQMQALFDAVETLAMMPGPIPGERLAILTNGGGVGVLATDALMEREGRLAELSPRTLERLEAVLPSPWSRANPVDIMSDAPAERYADALDVIFEDKNVDAVLALNCPIATLSGADAARAVIGVHQKHSRKPKAPILLTSWLGEQAPAEARRLFAEHRIPTYKTPYDAVRAFMHMVRYQRSQEMLMETPPSIPETFSPDVETALRVIGDALTQERAWLTKAETQTLLKAYGIPMVCFPSGTTADPMEDTAGTLTAPLGKTSLGDWIPESPEQSIPLSPNPCELRIQMVDDPQFGPVITFGRGGRYSRETQDKAIAFPPLNIHLACEVMSRTRVYRFLKGKRRTLPAQVDTVALTLAKVSQIICDIAEIAELDINPLLVDASGVAALHARIRVARSAIPASERLAIRPYPKELEDVVILADGRTLQMRPIRPEDEPGFQKIFESLTPEERRMRFFHPMQELSHHEAARLTQIDYDREMALVLADKGNAFGAAQELYGSVRIMADPDNDRAEYSILVHKAMAGKGLGKMLMKRIINYARSRGIKEIFGQVLSENIPMLKVCKTLGFTLKHDPDDVGVIIVSLRL